MFEVSLGKSVLFLGNPAPPFRNSSRYSKDRCLFSLSSFDLALSNGPTVFGEQLAGLSSLPITQSEHSVRGGLRVEPECLR